MTSLVSFIALLKDLVWSPPILISLIGVGVYLTWILKGIQFRYLGYGLKMAFSSQESQGSGDITRFEALMTQLAGAIGTGCIVGIVTAITAGGYGAIFWMWVTALVGMATKYSESILAVRFRVMDDRGEMCGGPMYYIERGLKWKKMAVLFAFFGSVAAIGTGNMVQANAIADVLNVTYGLDPFWMGTLLAGLTGLVLIGGVKSIGKVTSVLVPFMALFYIVGAGAVLVVHIKDIPEALWLIVSTAFTGQAAAGGFLGATAMMAIQMGVSRGVFTNESGLGISSIAAAAAKTDHAGRQAIVSMIGTFISTILVCTATALVLIVTGVIGSNSPTGEPLAGAGMVVAAFNSVMSFGGMIVSIGLVLFAYSTMLGWAYYGEKCCEYIFGERSINWYRVLFSLIVIPGAMLDLEVVWNFADVANGLMVIPNIIALTLLSKVILNETDEFFNKIN